MGKVLFKLFVNELESGVSSGVTEFADDKLFRLVKMKGHARNSETMPSNWANGHEMQFDVSKSKVVHIEAEHPASHVQ